MILFSFFKPYVKKKTSNFHDPVDPEKSLSRAQTLLDFTDVKCTETQTLMADASFRVSVLTQY